MTRACVVICLCALIACDESSGPAPAPTAVATLRQEIASRFRAPVQLPRLADHLMRPLRPAATFIAVKRTGDASVGRLDDDLRSHDAVVTTIRSVGAEVEKLLGGTAGFGDARTAHARLARKGERMETLLMLEKGLSVSSLVSVLDQVPRRVVAIAVQSVWVRQLPFVFAPASVGDVRPATLYVGLDDDGISILGTQIELEQAEHELRRLADEKRGGSSMPLFADVSIASTVPLSSMLAVLGALWASGVTELQLTIIPTGPNAGDGRLTNVARVAIGSPNAQGDLDKAIIHQYVKRTAGKLQACYQQRLNENPDLAEGTVSTQFFITPSGTVASSSGSGVDEKLAACIAQVIKDIVFPKPKGGGGVQVNYPFTFRSTVGE